MIGLCLLLFPVAIVMSCRVGMGWVGLGYFVIVDSARNGMVVFMLVFGYV